MSTTCGLLVYIQLMCYMQTFSVIQVQQIPCNTDMLLMAYSYNTTHVSHVLHNWPCISEYKQIEDTLPNFNNKFHILLFHINTNMHVNQLAVTRLHAHLTKVPQFSVVSMLVPFKEAQVNKHTTYIRYHTQRDNETHSHDNIIIR